jgi:hypothetical protein
MERSAFSKKTGRTTIAPKLSAKVAAATHHADSISISAL